MKAVVVVVVVEEEEELVSSETLFVLNFNSISQ